MCVTVYFSSKLYKNSYIIWQILIVAAVKLQSPIPFADLWFDL